MRKTLLAILLILGIVLSSASCTMSDPDAENIPVWDPTDTSEVAQKPSTDTEPTQTPSNPAELIGKWHWQESALVLQFFSNETVKAYFLTPGYYEHYLILDGTYSYDGLTLSFTLTDGPAFTGACSVKDGLTSITYYFQSYTLSPVTELPVEHPSYTFPDFRTISQSATLPDGAYTGLTLEAEDIYRSALQNLVSQVSQGQITPTLKNEGTARIGDVVVIDYEGKLDGVAFAGGTAQNQTVAVSDGTGMIDGFCAQIANHTVGKTFDVNVTFPADYGSADLAGKEVVFTMMLHGIYDIGEEFAKEYKSQLQAGVFKLIPSLCETSVPDTASLFFKQSVLDNYHYYAFNYGYDFNTFLLLNGLTEQQLIDEAVAIARSYLLSYLIAEKQNLTPDEDLTKEVRDAYIAQLIQQGFSAEQAEAYLQNEGKNAYEAKLMLNLITVYLIENNTFSPAL